MLPFFAPKTGSAPGTTRQLSTKDTAENNIQNESTPSQVSKKTRGRPPLPRDENGKLIRNN
ncbi:hypothetical protein BpHYR1_008401 [Brachionus plicatilis]|uniref:Uncharacterized protein n=1 Tax=Brachionus plicatilis TaxID=10195 RepID=A0A3M7RX57_BRAPC|nr:hypothetical protein BpHYR1_008401 [Brachionus plicatilis]